MSDRIAVRFIRPFQAYRRGDVIQVDRGPAQGWIAAGIVVPVADQSLLEIAAVERENVETADATPRRKRR
jgi:hypothetical protein